MAEVWTHWNYEYGEVLLLSSFQTRVWKTSSSSLSRMERVFFDRYNEQIEAIEEEGTSVFEIISPKQEYMGASLSPDGRKLILLAPISTKVRISIFQSGWK